MRHAYGLDRSGLTGAGQFTAVPTPDGSPGEDPRDGGAIDAEAVHGIAPDANIVAIGESTAQGTNLLDSLIYAMDRTDASLVSASLGFDPVPGLRKAYDQVFQEDALQGVGGTSPATGSAPTSPWTRTR